VSGGLAGLALPVLVVLLAVADRRAAAAFLGLCLCFAWVPALAALVWALDEPRYWL